MSIPKLITSSQLAERLGLKSQTLSKWRTKGSGPDFVRLHGDIYYEEAVVQKWLDSNRHKSTAEYESPLSSNGFSTHPQPARV